MSNSFQSESAIKGAIIINSQWDLCKEDFKMHLKSINEIIA